jgi:predicted  nucleic acid-binding Zn-ribbon protein
VFHYRNTLFHSGTDHGFHQRFLPGVQDREPWSVPGFQWAGVNTPLEQLYRLQDRIRFVRARELERDTIPSELVEVDREFREKVDAVDRLKKRRAEAEVERRRAHAELSEHREKLRKYQTQLRAVQNQREYGAVLNEIDGVEKLVRSAEDRILNLDEEIENAGKELVTREEMLPLETEQHEERLKDWRSAQRVINEELASAQEEIQRLEASMHPRDRSEFQRLLEKKGGLAIVFVSGNSCSACHVKVRPAALQALKAGREIIYCDSCKRILYWDMQRS